MKKAVPSEEIVCDGMCFPQDVAPGRRIYETSARSAAADYAAV
jgi:hypothetical protein